MARKLKSDRVLFLATILLVGVSIVMVYSVKPLTIVFSESAAPLKQIARRRSRAASTSRPPIAGTWFWVERQGTAVHAEERLAGRRRVHRAVREARGCSPSGCCSRTTASSSRASRSPRSIADSQFYQDPRDPNLKKLVATVAVQPSGRHRAVRIARVARGGQGRRVSGPDARQPALHGGLRQVQARRPTSIRRRWPCRATTRR